MLQLSPTKLDSTSNPNRKRQDHKTRPRKATTPEILLIPETHINLMLYARLDIFTLNSSPQTTCTGPLHPDKSAPTQTGATYTQGLPTAAYTGPLHPNKSATTYTEATTLR
ncbi:unnamed protein product [Microthlaspi erraticum]|uniref:Uncharacterized protein n=1 Tax=Microthlaspi erraticum TaxID=1685480 RepID=A0A6D2JHT7_9BRAS|nr:unnamed protein product [Microthlaspi erraticum]